MIITPPPTYQITIRGHLNARWESWFEGFTIRQAYDPAGAAITQLTGHVTDQAALYGLLARLRNLGAELVGLHKLGD